MSKNDIGLGAPLFVKGIKDVLSRSAGDDLRRFLLKFDDLASHKWILVSDYTIHDDNKKVDVMVFSLLPYLIDFEQFASLVRQLAPYDLKQTEKINATFEDFLRVLPGLHFAIIMPKGFSWANPKTETYKTVKLFVSGYRDMLAEWERSTPEAAAKYLPIRKEMEKTLKNLDRPNKAWCSNGGRHVRKIYDIITLASIAFVLLQRIIEIVPCSQICWMADRDGTMEWPKCSLDKGELFFNFVCDYLHIDFSNRGAKFDLTKLLIVKPSPQGRNWYDEYIRIPDYIAGVISRIDMNTGFTIERFRGILEKVIANNVSLIPLRIDDKGVCRLEFLNK